MIKNKQSPDKKVPETSPILDTCKIEPPKPISNWKHSGKINLDEITQYRKIIAHPSQSFALALIIKFLENLVYESTPSPSKQFVMNLCDSIKANSIKDTYYFKYLYGKHKFLNPKFASFLKNICGNGNLSKKQEKFEMVAQKFCESSDMVNYTINFFENSIHENFPEISLLKNTEPQLLCDNLSKTLDTRICYYFCIAPDKMIEYKSSAELSYKLKNTIYIYKTFNNEFFILDDNNAKEENQIIKPFSDMQIDNKKNQLDIGKYELKELHLKEWEEKLKLQEKQLLENQQKHDIKEKEYREKFAELSKIQQDNKSFIEHQNEVISQMKQKCEAEFVKLNEKVIEYDKNVHDFNKQKQEFQKKCEDFEHEKTILYEKVANLQKENSELNTEISMLQGRSVHIADLKCKICYTFSPNSNLGCGHIFCGKCTKDLKDKNKPCPFCNMPIKEIHRIYEP